ncbi:MAG: FtsX-like permease family protein, partial [Candidatus Bipolaricaulota bacterium]
AQVEARQVFLPLAAAQIILGAEAVDRLVVSLEDLELTAQVAAALQGSLGAAGLGLEIRTWDELSPFYTQLSGFFDILFGLLIMAVFVLVFFILLQVLTLAFSERIREVGTLRALGTKQGQVMQLFVGEAAWLGLLGGAIGVSAGALLAAAFNAAAIPWQPPGSLEPVTLAVRISWPAIVVPLAVSTLSTILSAVFPAFQAGRVSVVEALRVN